MDSSPDVDVSSVVLPLERYRQHGSSGYRLLGPRSARALKKSRLFRSMAARAAPQSKYLTRRFLNGRRNVIYRRGISVRSLRGSQNSGTHNPKYTINLLSIDHLTRDLHDQHLTCLAANNNVTAPTTARATISMNRE